MTLLQFAHEHPVVTVLVIAIPFFSACTIAGIWAGVQSDRAKAAAWAEYQAKHGIGQVGPRE